MSFTYSSLKTAIQNYTENDETTFTNNLDIFIKNAEEFILKNVQLTNFRKNSTGVMASANEYLGRPSDLLAPFSLCFTSNSLKTFLELKDVNFIQTFNPNSATTGAPRYYAMFDTDYFILGPTPDSNYAVELHYYYRPVSLTAAGDSGTTWLSTNAPVALLYGSLIEAYTFMKGDPQLLADYQKRFMEALSGLKTFGEAKEVTDGYRTGLVLRQKT
tara:strand:+ start:1278 stop:1925 length:648 start_codon:yes stop_codon:yes gene_type:complete